MVTVWDCEVKYTGQMGKGTTDQGYCMHRCTENQAVSPGKMATMIKKGFMQKGLFPNRYPHVWFQL